MPQNLKKVSRKCARRILTKLGVRHTRKKVYDVADAIESELSFAVTLTVVEYIRLLKRDKMFLQKQKERT